MNNLTQMRFCLWLLKWEEASGCLSKAARLQRAVSITDTNSILILSLFYFLHSSVHLSSKQQDYLSAQIQFISPYFFASRRTVVFIFSSNTLPNCFSLCNFSEVVRERKQKTLSKWRPKYFVFQALTVFPIFRCTSNKNLASWDLYSKPWILFNSSVLFSDKVVFASLCDNVGASVPSKSTQFLTLLFILGRHPTSLWWNKHLEANCLQ